LPNRRRAFLRQLASVTLVGGAVTLADRAEAASTSPDAELIALGAELRTAWAIERDAYSRHEGNDTPEVEEMLGAFVTATKAVVDKIEALRATTLEGLKVKALAISWAHCGEPIEDRDFAFNHQYVTTDVRLVASIIRDLLATGS
jgi:hypothetical protein